MIAFDPRTTLRFISFNPCMTLRLISNSGRKKFALVYCVTYILSCVTKHSPDYWILMLGRFFGGIATSLLFSAFESWLVAEHFKVSVPLVSQRYISVTPVLCHSVSQVSYCALPLEGLRTYAIVVLFQVKDQS
jgi:hypothetical protein